jgi:hypothetical protein
MLMVRDQNLFDSLIEFHIMTTSQIHKLYYSNTCLRTAQRRLSVLHERGYLKRILSTISNEHAYYLDKRPVQIHHDLIRSELYANMKTKFKVLEWGNEVTIENIRPDALVYVEDHGIPFPLFVEIHLNNKFNFDKYRELTKSHDLRALFGILPRIIICTDRELTIQNVGLKVKIIDLSMKGLDNLFK